MSNHDFPSLVGSRICHDLASPIGAIGNGVELLAMSTGISEEMKLVQDALESAAARLELFRVAFGSASKGQMLAGAQMISMAERLTKTGRHKMTWQCGIELSRVDARAALLAVLCAENALPFGGEINVHEDFRITGTGRRIDLKPELWDPVVAGHAPVELAGAQVQFGLLPDALADAGRTLSVNSTDADLEITLNHI